MTYNTNWQPMHQPDPRRAAEAMRRFFQNRSGGQFGGDEGRDYNRGEYPGYNPGNPYEENGHWEQKPHRQPMGFNPGQNSHQHEYGMPHREYQREEHEFDKRMEDYFRRLNEGRVQVPDALCELVANGVHMYMGNSGGGSRREWQHGDSDEEEHARFKEAIEKLREAPSMQEKERLMKELFPDDLTAEELTVLRDMANTKSYRQKARDKWGPNATADRWMEVRKALKHKYKLKHSA